MKRCFWRVFWVIGVLGCADHETTPVIDSGMFDAQQSKDMVASEMDAAPGDGGESTDVGLTNGGPVDSQPQGPEPPYTGRWEVRAPVASGAIQEIAVVALGGELYLLGGFDEDRRIVATVSIYHPETDTWRQGPDLPTSMHHANAAAVGGKIYVLGALKEDFEEDGRGYVYDPATRQWRRGPDLPAGTARGASGVTVSGDEIVLIGGLGGRRAVSIVSAYDVQTETWRSLPDLPGPARDHMAVGTIDGQIVVAGGRDGRIGRHVSLVHVFDDETGEWRNGAPMPTSRGGGAAAVCGDALYVLGGEGNPDTHTGVFDQVEMYHPRLNQWTSLSPMESPRHGNGAAAIDGWIYVPGGADVQAFGAVSTHHRMECAGPSE